MSSPLQLLQKIREEPHTCQHLVPKKMKMFHIFHQIAGEWIAIANFRGPLEVQRLGNGIPFGCRIFQAIPGSGPAPTISGKSAFFGSSGKFLPESSSREEEVEAVQIDRGRAQRARLQKAGSAVAALAGRGHGVIENAPGGFMDGNFPDAPVILFSETAGTRFR